MNCTSDQKTTRTVVLAIGHMNCSGDPKTIWIVTAYQETKWTVTADQKTTWTVAADQKTTISYRNANKSSYDGEFSPIILNLNCIYDL